MENLSIIAEGVQKRFSHRTVFRSVSFEAAPGEIIAITGSNGAGKSTLLKIVANVLSPTKGSCQWAREGKKLDNNGIRVSLGFVAPYLELYDELTAVEHVEFVASMKGLPFSRESAFELLDRFGLDSAIAKGDRRLRAYSSGMKQRVRCAMAFACSPGVLLLDEPTSNLDDAGTDAVLKESVGAALAGAIVFIATNDARECGIATRVISIEPI